MPLKKSPVASAQMVRANYYGVEVDVCPVSGGVWLDKGELKTIVETAKNDNFIEEFNRFHSRPQPVIDHRDHLNGYNIYVQENSINLAA